MNKEEILAKSREENKNQDEREKLAIAKASQNALAVGGILCALMLIFNAIFCKTFNYAVWGIYLAITGSSLLFKFVYLKKKHELIFGLIEIGLAIMFIVFYVVNEVK
ncbi:MAG: DUF6442 family protein [Ruminococcus sp.]|nr:DUF6442 family protein [Ruminococcus sp.]